MSNPTFEEVLSYLRAERAELDYVIAALERRTARASAESAPAQASPPQPRPRKRKPKAKPAAKPRAARGSNAEIAEWRAKLIAPILAHPKGSDERRAAFKALAGTEVPGPNGEPRLLRAAALYLYVQQAEGTVGSRSGAEA